ncbi:hypothetical protein DelCs14_3253 [Delftia sp. Cs1-4]|uniref:hypothetical protein n=1 Tax=Delftia sp. (strain Cs1-4) TaxID=742013 RepID=UPI00020E82AE|nr:hypothetical protein [Delftia sp. Cs1-4]AEF90253.1 hypothetical protein DelCs14_3253 [Delftia sp. Cs1-4]
MKTIIAITSLALSSSIYASNVWLYSTPQTLPPIINTVGSNQVNTLTSLNFSLGNFNYTPTSGNENFTGLVVPANLKSTYERSTDPNWYGASFVQTYENKFSFFINSDSAPINNRPLALYTSNFQINFTNDIRPWSATYGDNPSLCNAFFAAVPTSWHGGGSHNQGGFNFNLTDISTGLVLSPGGLYYDSTPSNLVQQSGLDEETQWFWVAASYGNQNYFTTSPGSSNGRSTTWNTEDWFGLCIYKNNLLTMVDAANQTIQSTNVIRAQKNLPALPYFSRLPANYRLNFAVLGGEIVANRPATGHMGARFREWNIFIQQ